VNVGFHPVHRRRWRPIGVASLISLVALLASGCGVENWERGYLPGEPGVTNQTDRIASLWTGSWIAAMAVGILTWGLIIWCVVVYRRRKNDNTLPVQLRYHVPLELMYTVLPVFMIAVLFFYTQRDMGAIVDTAAEPDVRVQVYGKMWSWDFNYLDDDVYDTGIQAVNDGRPGVAETLPTLYLPVNERVEFTVNSRDVIHSFWVPAFLFKRDVIPGRTSSFQIVPEREGLYQGKCAELCGEYHSDMLFNVAVVSRAEYDAHIADLRERGQVGALGSDLDRIQTPETTSVEEGSHS
jgi:cytochrome c oxidase subunit 2